MTKTESRNAALLDARYLRNLCAAADLLDTIAESGIAQDPDAVHDIAGHLRNYCMHSPNTTLAKLREAQDDKATLAKLALVRVIVQQPRDFIHSRQ